jgi:chorismate synthase
VGLKKGGSMLRYLTAGESHGRALVAILEGLPAGVKISEEQINAELKRRQQGFGRGKRMQIESDRAQIVSGLKGSVTLGSPVTLVIENKDASIEKLHKVTCPRPGHADLAGFLKYGVTDIREILERASARSTAAIVAVGAVCKILLREFSVSISSSVKSVGGQWTAAGQIEKIKEAIAKGDTVGGVCEIVARGVPIGLGSYSQPDRRLDARLAQSLMAIPGIKAFEIGLGFGYSQKLGSQVHDAIYYQAKKGFVRKTNNAGGIEGGISNGHDIVLRCCMKPIATLMRPLESVNIITKKPAKAAVERSDVCVVEAAGVVAENACAFVLADALLEKFGADNLADIRQAYKAYLKRIK